MNYISLDTQLFGLNKNIFNEVIENAIFAAAYIKIVFRYIILTATTNYY